MVASSASAVNSSPAAALEGVLRRLINRVASPGTPEEMPDLMDELGEETTTGKYELSRAEEVSATIERALQQLEEVKVDSKLGAFSKLFADRFQRSDPAPKAVILTEFTATLFYLAADLEEHKNYPLLVHGGLTFDERARALYEFSSVGGILIVTKAMIQTGVDFRGATDLALYDVPRFSKTLAQVLGRFDRIGRAKELNVYAFRSTNAPFGPSLESLDVLRHRQTTDA